MDTYHLIFKIRENQYIICSNIRAMTKDMVCEIATQWLCRRGIDLNNSDVLVLNAGEYAIFINDGHLDFGCTEFDKLKKYSKDN